LVAEAAAEMAEAKSSLIHLDAKTRQQIELARIELQQKLDASSAKLSAFESLSGNTPISTLNPETVPFVIQSQQSLKVLMHSASQPAD